MIPREINSSTRLYCIFGDPVSHSLSPAMHNAAFSALGINAVYLAFRPRSIGDALEAMRTLPIDGASVTIPYKSEAVSLVDSLDPLAAGIGAINTLSCREGLITGFNTDGLGALMALTASGADPKKGKTLILGNGGSARAIAFTIAAEGGKTVIAGRNPERYMPLVQDLRVKEPTVECADISRLNPEMMIDICTIINTTPVGMGTGLAALPLPGELINSNHTVFDIVYSPHQTPLLTLAAQKGCRTVYGRDMLLYQGAKQCEIWTGLKAPVDVMRTALESLPK